MDAEARGVTRWHCCGLRVCDHSAPSIGIPATPLISPFPMSLLVKFASPPSPSGLALQVQLFPCLRFFECSTGAHFRASAVVIYLLHIHTCMIRLVLVFVLARMIGSTMFLFHIEIEIENLNKHALMHIDTCSAPSPWREAPNCAVHHVVATVVLIWGNFSRFSLLLIKSSILRIM